VFQYGWATIGTAFSVVLINAILILKFNFHHLKNKFRMAWYKFKLTRIKKGLLKKGIKVPERG
jgi:hypothetical protein